jgi:hypothetical protein
MLNNGLGKVGNSIQFKKLDGAILDKTISHPSAAHHVILTVEGALTVQTKLGRGENTPPLK